MNETLERKYALTKIKAGDYLLPSNDAQTIWRITRYEDGPSYGVDREYIPKDRTFWGVWRWEGGTGPTVDVEDWDGWIQDAAGLDSRNEAIREAMRLSS